MPLGRIRDDEQPTDSSVALPRRTVGRPGVPDPEYPMVTLSDVDPLGAVLAGLIRMVAGGAR